MERYKLRRLIAGSTLGILGGLGLSGCAEAPLNYEGQGQAFTVRGKIAEVEDDGTIKIHQDDLEVISAEGKAIEWFPDHDGQDIFSEKFNFLQKFKQEPGGWFSCGDDVVVGEAFDIESHPIEPQDLSKGDMVEISGHIRESIYYQSYGKSGACEAEDLAVYDVAKQIN